MATHLDYIVLEDKHQWNRFVVSSPQGNVFSTTAFLDALGAEYDLLLVEENGLPQVGAIVLKSDKQVIHAPHPCTLYQGVFFESSIRDMPHHSRIQRGLERIGFLLEEMAKRYNRISFCLHHTVEDLRSFQWFHYHEPERGQFRIELRYTALLNLLAVPDFDTYLSGIRKVRRYEYRRAQSDGLQVQECSDVAILNHLHRMTFQRQGIERSQDEERLLLSISEAALREGFGRLLVCRNKHGKAISANLFVYDANCGYYLFGANDPEYRRSGAGTYILLESIRYCKQRELSRVDFVGINSPNRGGFKSSFNGAPVPYFVVTWEG